MSEYKVSKEIKWTFIFNVLLFIAAIALGEQVALAVSVIVFSMLSVGIQILEAIHKLESTKGV